jgi:hypothetical protein
LTKVHIESVEYRVRTASLIETPDDRAVPADQVSNEVTLGSLSGADGRTNQTQSPPIRLTLVTERFATRPETALL